MTHEDDEDIMTVLGFQSDIQSDLIPCGPVILYTVQLSGASANSRRSILKQVFCKIRGALNNTLTVSVLDENSP